MPASSTRRTAISPRRTGLAVAHEIRPSRVDHIVDAMRQDPVAGLLDDRPPPSFVVPGCRQRPAVVLGDHRVLRHVDEAAVR